MSNRVITATAILAIGVAIGLWLLANAYSYKYKDQHTIVVTGAAEQNFVSDLVVWTASFSKNNYELQAAFAALKEDEQKVRAYLKQMGIAESEFKFSAVRIDKQFTTQYDASGRTSGTAFAGYQLNQTVKLESKDIAKIDRISREVTGLIQQGVELNSEAPSYFYTKLGDLKIDLLAKASEDGKNRAQTIAKNSGESLSNLKKASMGIFQITGQNENEDYSYGGAFNTSSLNKTATITVRMEFGVN